MRLAHWVRVTPKPHQPTRLERIRDQNCRSSAGPIQSRATVAVSTPSWHLRRDLMVNLFLYEIVHSAHRRPLGFAQSGTVPLRTERAVDLWADSPNGHVPSIFSIGLMMHIAVHLRRTCTHTGRHVGGACQVGCERMGMSRPRAGEHGCICVCQLRHACVSTQGRRASMPDRRIHRSCSHGLL